MYKVYEYVCYLDASVRKVVYRRTKSICFFIYSVPAKRSQSFDGTNYNSALSRVALTTTGIISPVASGYA